MSPVVAARGLVAAALLALAALALQAPAALAAHTPADADLEVTSTESSDPVIAGSNGGVGNLAYVVTLRNNGPVAVQSARVNVRITAPSGVSEQSVTPSTGEWQSGSKTWTVGAMAPSQTATLTISLNVGADAPDDSTIRIESSATPTGNLVGDHQTANNTSVLTTLVERPAAAAIAPSAHDFGQVATGTTSPAQEFTVSNSGGLDLVLGQLALAGADASDFEIVGDACSEETLAPGESCTVSAAFAPGSSGAKQAAIEVPSDAAGPAPVAALSGTGVLLDASLTPSAHDFGAARVGSAGDVQAFRFSNDGSGDLAVSGVTLTGADAGDFELVSDACTGQTVAGGSACEVTVRLAPGSTGAKQATLEVASDAPGSPESAQLAGEGVEPQAALTPAEHAFGSVRAGTASDAQAFTLANEGSGPLAVAGVALAGDDAGEFEVVSDECSGASVAPGASCAVAVRFAPTARGARQASLEISSDAPGAPHGAALSGTGVAPVAELAPASHDFGAVTTATESAPQELTLTNAGDGDLTVSGVTLAGDDAGDFALSDDGCASAVVAAGESCTVSVRFAPASDGGKAARLEIASDAPGSPAVATLAGTAEAPAAAIDVDPETADFGAVEVGDESEPRTFTATNDGTAGAEVHGAFVDGEHPDDYEVVADGCEAVVLAPGEACEVDVAFVPQARGARSGELALDTDAPQAVSELSGEGVVRSSSLSAASHDFGSRQVGSEGEAATLTFANDGDLPVGVESAGIAGDHAGDFRRVADGCGGTTLAAGESCEVSVAFAPTAAGARSAALRVVSDDAPGGREVALSGTGTAAQEQPNEEQPGDGGGTGGGTGGGGSGDPTAPAAPATPVASVARARGARLRTARRGRRTLTTLDTGVRVRCPAGLPDACTVRIVGRGVRATATVPAGRSRIVRLRLTRSALAALRARRGLTVAVRVVSQAADGRRATAVERYRFTARGSRVRVRDLS